MRVSAHSSVYRNVNYGFTALCRTERGPSRKPSIFYFQFYICPITGLSLTRKTEVFENFEPENSFFCEISRILSIHMCNKKQIKNDTIQRCLSYANRRETGNSLLDE